MMISEVSNTVITRFLSDAKRWKYAGLLTAEPSSFRAVGEATSGKERAARVEIQWSDAYTGGLIRNSNVLRWLDLDWGQRVTHVGLFTGIDNIDAGFWGELDAPTVIQVPQGADVAGRHTGIGAFQIDAGRLAIRIA